MNRWDEQLADHAIHETLSEARKLVESKHKETTAETEIERRRFLKVVDQIETILSQIDPETVPFNLMDNLNNGIRHQNVWNQISTYSSNGDGTNLAAANNGLSAQLPTINQLAGFSKQPETKKYLKSLERSVDAFTSTISEKKAELVEEIDALDIRKSEIGVELDELTSQIGTKKEEIDGLVTDWQSQFTEAQMDRDAGYQEWRKTTATDIETKATDLINETSSKFDDKNNSFSKLIDELIGDAQAKHSKILELHEIVAGDSVAAGYLQNAQEEKGQANFWRWASIIFIALTAVWTVFAYVKVPSADFSGIGYWGQALKAFSVAGVLLFGAIYSSKQSNIHRESEQRTRWLALEVKAIDPFISSLSSEDQKELKKTLSEKLFGQSRNSESAIDNSINEHLIETIIKRVTDANKASKP